MSGVAGAGETSSTKGIGMASTRRESAQGVRLHRVEEWELCDRPGYFGSRRDEIERGYDEKYGPGCWRLAWQVGVGVFFTREQMTMLYEDAYYTFLHDNVDVLEMLLSEAADVYDDAPSNVESGFDYTCQETGRTHVQDIAIRRVVTRLGERFHGSRLIQIRDDLGDHPLSMTLSPGQVPFHFPELIRRPETTGWWQSGSVESFYQSNKVLQRLVAAGPELERALIESELEGKGWDHRTVQPAPTHGSGVRVTQRGHSYISVLNMTLGRPTRLSGPDAIRLSDTLREAAPYAPQGY